MNTIRPIVTISLLALVGIFLYMKMTAKDPPLPEDMADWDVASELNIGGDQSGVPGLNFGGSDAQSEMPPAFTPSAPVAEYSEAPAPFVADQAPPAMPEEAPSEFNGGVPSEPVEAPPYQVAVPEAPEAPAYGQADMAPPLAPETQPPVAEAEQAPAYEPEPAPVVVAPPIVEQPVAEPAPVTPGDRYGNATPPAAPYTNVQPPADSYGSAPPPMDRYGSAEGPAPSEPQESPAQPSVVTGEPVTPTPSLFASTRIAAQSALDRGELSQALLLLSDWYGDPSLSPGEESELDTLLSQLAGSVIYSTEHRIEPPYRVQAGQRLQDIAQEYNVPWQLLAKINRVEDPNNLQPGSELKVVRGPFEAVVDIRRRSVVLMLDRRYAGRFQLEVEPGVNVEEGLWTVDQKLLTPGSANPAFPGAPSDERSLMLTNPVAAGGQVAILRGPGTPGAASADPPGRVIRLNSTDIGDLFDILSVGSRVVIRR